MKLISLTTIFLFFSVLIPAFAGPPILRENKKYTGPRIKESETPAGKFNKKITGLPPAEAVNLIKEYNSQHGKKFDSLSKKKSRKRTAFQESRRKRIYIAGRHFTPQKGIEKSLGEKTQKTENKEKEIIAIIQFERDCSMNETIAMMELGLTYLGPIGHSSILVKLPLKSIKKLEQFEFIKWVGEYKDEYKYAAAPPKNTAKGAYIKIFGEPKPEYKQQLSDMGIHVQGFYKTINSYTVNLHYKDFNKVAIFPWVRRISKQKKLTPQTDYYEPDDSREIISAPDSWGIGFTGSGVIVGVQDSGIQTDNTIDFPSGSIHPDSYLGDDETGHGSHVSGIIASRGRLNVIGEYDVKGVAPDAQIYMVTKSTYTSVALSKWKSASVQVANLSVGINGDYSYDATTDIIDSHANDNDIVITVAAGNTGNIGDSTIELPATGKNVISVGNIDSRPSNIGKLYINSSKGPTQDSERMKPELVAPGAYIISNSSHCSHGNWTENPC